MVYVYYIFSKNKDIVRQINEYISIKDINFNDYKEWIKETKQVPIKSIEFINALYAIFSAIFFIIIVISIFVIIFLEYPR